VDGRIAPSGRTTRYSLRNDTWATVDADEDFDGWFERNLRCSKTSFDIIVHQVEQRWIGTKPHWNAAFPIRMRVAVTMYYLASSGSIKDAGNVFGISKSSGVRFVNEVKAVLVSMSPEIICLPQSEQHWYDNSLAFEEQSGFPFVAGVVDGSLIEIERPYDHEGWYSRKFYTAVNVQVVCDHRKRIISFAIRSGSNNDKMLWSGSSFGQSIDQTLPVGLYILGDSGTRPDRMTKRRLQALSIRNDPVRIRTGNAPPKEKV
jgi:hypothetical protein